VVDVADDELFGPDGTQAPPVTPFLADPLAGLVTGSVFADTTAGPEFETVGPDVAAATATSPARRPGVRTPPPRTIKGRPQARTLQPATSPDAIPVAAPLSARAGIPQSRPPAARATPMGATPTRVTPIRPAPPRVAPAGWQPTPRTPRTPPAGRGTPDLGPRRTAASRRSTGAGCSFLLVLIVVMVIAFVILGIALGHGGTG
jgi:hypothetical protein